MYIVTGVSRGLGKAIVEILLEKGNTVIGIGRNSSIQNKNYRFLVCDFNHPEEISQLNIPKLEGKITLINNAGIIGEIKRVSDQDEWDLSQVLQVNTIAPMQLAKNVYSNVKDKKNFTLVNISSGAANRSVPSWASYCASKAALNRLTENFYLEELEKGNELKVYCVSPGVIDTAMQEVIRSAKSEDFSSLKSFIDLKENQQLFSPKEAAKKLLKLLQIEYSKELFYDLRNI